MKEKTKYTLYIIVLILIQFLIIVFQCFILIGLIFPESLINPFRDLIIDLEENYKILVNFIVLLITSIGIIAIISISNLVNSLNKLREKWVEI